MLGWPKRAAATQAPVVSIHSLLWPLHSPLGLQHPPTQEGLLAWVSVIEKTTVCLSTSPFYTPQGGNPDFPDLGIRP